MNPRSQAEKAEILRALHSTGIPLVLPNIWNPIGARILEAKGYPAVATASAALSASLGYQDGERIKLSTLLDFLGRIARSVEVPVTADIEAGFAETLGELEHTILWVLDAGVVGINIEDSIGEGNVLRPTEEQCQRIALVREVATRQGVPLVINARVDSFLTELPREAAIEEAVARARSYKAAGADCIFPVGPGDEETVRVLRERICSPINILGSPSAAPLSVLRAIGVNRVSFGPFVFRACLRTFVDLVEGLRDSGDYGSLARMIPRTEVEPLLRPGPE